MADNTFLSHTGSDGSTIISRILDAGYSPLVWAAENAGAGGGLSSAQSIVNAWMASPPHCATLMSPKFKDTGVACEKSSSGAYYWTMDAAAHN